MAEKKFTIFSWQHDFIDALAEFILSKGELHKTLVLFPHSRPAKYLQPALQKKMQGPLIMPRCMTIQELFAQLGAELPLQPSRQASLLDQVALLYQAVKTTTQQSAKQAFQFPEGRQSRLHFPLESPEHFLPWGVRLANLMEEFFNARLLPDNYRHLDGVVTDFAALLLANLASIHSSYLKLLQAHDLTTAGLMAFNVANQALEGLDTEDPVFSFLHGRNIIVAGFNRLSGVEEPVLRYLWSRENAEFCLHTDPLILNDRQQAHWSCTEQINQIRKWKAKAELFDSSADEHTFKSNCKRSGSFTVYEGYDLHSQLDKLSEVLGEQDQEKDTAIILPTPSLLLPLLHSLPNKNINISMGYPLSRSPLARLLTSIMDLQDSAQIFSSSGDTTNNIHHYHWKALIRLLRQPYLRMLGEEKKLPLREIFSSLEAHIMQGGRFISLPEIKLALANIVRSSLPLEMHLPLFEDRDKTPDAELIAKTAELLEELLPLLISRWEQIETTGQLAEILMDLCRFLINHGQELWHRFPLDGEYLYRLMHNVIPALSESLFTSETLSRPTLFALLKAGLEAERVPFEAYPLEGIQVLGMLESRLLSFENLYILDATEDSLPGISQQDPLLPDALRSEIGLPGLHEREQIMAHTFYRLINSGHNVHIFYQTGSGGIGILDDKKSRSRFVEELIWEAEKQKGKILKHGEPPLFSISLPLNSFEQKEKFIVRTKEINAAVDHWLQKGISPSSLDVYFTCPLRFFYEKIANVQPREDTPEGDDPLGIGILVHHVLETFFTPYRGHKITAGFKDQGARTALELLFKENLEASELKDTLPYDSLIMLEVSGPKKFRDLLNNMPDTEIVSLEHKFKTILPVENQQYTLYGRIDRIDKREDGLLVLDYKTGRLPKTQKGFWDFDNPLWFRMQHWQKEDKELLAECHNQAGSLQLPIYLYAYSQDLGYKAYDAAFVELAGQGKEAFLLGKNVEEDERERIISEQIPALLSFVIKHMVQTEEFLPQPGDHCRYCPWAGLCGQA